MANNSNLALFNNINGEKFSLLSQFFSLTFFGELRFSGC